MIVVRFLISQVVDYLLSEFADILDIEAENGRELTAYELACEEYTAEGGGGQLSEGTGGEGTRGGNNSQRTAAVVAPARPGCVCGAYAHAALFPCRCLSTPWCACATRMSETYGWTSSCEALLPERRRGL